ncbi:hypothetical protein [Mesorhizobium sp. LNJC405B00]|uniref:hypothetical protein n=1 Tax=unclassified Mesorhizobium TaxID=325217 RepID=UPI0003CE6905|nr:hypothetical protein [Mesorhizobium sp. LNJC405B00]ESX98740.1 hypothetical protein X755_15630 [Mesorhizobium sp. LNJC405B00]
MGSSLLVGFSSNQQIFAFHLTAEAVERGYQSIASFGGYSDIQCVTPGESRGSEADFYFCADIDLVKVTLTSLGTFKSSTVLASFSDALRYAIRDDDGDLVVWTDTATLKRINGTTGAVEYTKTVPYQIQAISSRALGAPDLQRLTEELYFTTGGVSYFTDLKTGLTRSISGADPSPALFSYDGEDQVILTVDGSGQPRRGRIISGDGEKRLLSDFLRDLMVHGGGYDPSEIAVENVDDLIDGAVVDVTASVREIARSICEPYSIAMFER